MVNIVKKDDNLLPALIKEVEDKIVVIRNLEVIADAEAAVLFRDSRAYSLALARTSVLVSAGGLRLC